MPSIVIGIVILLLSGATIGKMYFSDVDHHETLQENASLQTQVDTGQTIAQKLGTCLDAAQKRHQKVCPSSATIIKQVEREQGPQGNQGPAGNNGQPGRGISSTAIVDGDLWIYFSDGNKKDVGHITGAPGKDGEQGKPGKNGEQGKTGKGILSTTIAEGNLVVAYTDGTTKNIGPVIGPRGTSIAGVAVDSDYHLVVTYSDGTVADVGQLPPGRGIQQTVVDSNGHLQITFTDGTTVDAGPVIGPPGQTGPEGPSGPEGATGPAGRGIQSLLTDSNGNLQVTYTDGTTVSAGKVVGRGIKSADVQTQDDQSCHLIVTYTDDQTHDAGAVGCPIVPTTDPTNPPPT